MTKTHIPRGPELNQIRALLRSLLKAGRLEARRTYYDYYDSCHAPIETPDAPFEAIKQDTYAYDQWMRDLKAHGGALYLVEPGLYEHSTGYANYQIRVIK